MKRKIYLFIYFLFITLTGVIAQQNLPYSIGSDVTFNSDMDKVFSFNDVPGRFEYTFTKSGTYNALCKSTLSIYESNDGSNWGSALKSWTNDFAQSGYVNLKKTTRYVKVTFDKCWSNNASATLKGTSKITKSVNIEQSSIDVKTYANDTKQIAFKVYGSNLAGNLKIEMTENSSGYFSFSPVSISKAEAENAAGAEITVTYSPEVLGNHSAKIKVTDIDYNTSFDEIIINGTNSEPFIMYLGGEGKGTKDGSSWDNAMAGTNIGTAINTEGANEVWVAAGTYIINSTIIPKGGVNVYGGFIGTETQKSDRDWALNPTILQSSGTVKIIGSGNNMNVRTDFDGFILQGTTNARAVESTTPNLGLVNCIIRNNKFSSGTGAGIEFGAACFMENCLIYSNTASSHGGGLCVYGNPSIIVNCTFVNNSGGGKAKGVLSDNQSSFYNCIFASNIGSGSEQIATNNGSLPLIYNCLVSDGSNIIPNSNGNIKNADPGFINLSGNDYRLKLESVAIDGGDNSRLLNPNKDIFGNKRIQGSLDNPRIDIGAFEYNYFNISANIAEGSGTITGTGNYRVNAPATIIASASDPINFRFKEWKQNGMTVSTDQSYTFNVTTDVILEAYFEEKSITSITIDQLSLNQIYDELEKNIGYNTVPEGLNCTVSYKQNGVEVPHVNSGEYDIEVVFAGNDLYKPSSATATLSVSKAASSITSQPVVSDIILGGSLAESTFISCSASVAGVFNWTNPSERPTVTSEHEITFTPTNTNYLGTTCMATVVVNCILTISDTEGGTLTITPFSADGKYEVNSSVTLTATPEPRYSFTGWWDSDLSGNIRNYAVTSNNTLEATFTMNINTYTGQGNWNESHNWSDGVLPVARQNVLINGNLIINSDAECNDMTIAGTVTIESSAKLKANSIINVNENWLVINSDINGKLPILFISTDCTPSCCVNQYVKNDWQLMASPLAEAITAYPAFKGFYLDDWNETSGEWNRLVDSDIVKPKNAYSVGYFNALNRMIKYRGKLNTSDRVVYDELMSYTDGMGSGDYGSGWNLLGNPWMTPVDLTVTNSSVSTDMEGAFYIYDNGNYKAYGILSHIGTFDGIIPASQGFFVRTNGENPSLTINEVAKSDTDKPPFKSENILPKLTFKVEGQLYQDEIIIVNDEKCTSGFDNGYDARKIYGDIKAPQLYELTIDGQMFSVSVKNNFDATILGFEKGEDINYVLTVKPENCDLIMCEKITLTDLKTGVIIDITNGGTYEFTSFETDQHNRFKIGFSSLGTAEQETSSVNIFAYGNIVTIEGTNENSIIYIIDMNGKIVNQSTGNGGKVKIEVARQGAYVVRVVDNEFVKNNKVIIR